MQLDHRDFSSEICSFAALKGFHLCSTCLLPRESGSRAGNNVTIDNVSVSGKSETEAGC